MAMCSSATTPARAGVCAAIIAQQASAPAIPFLVRMIGPRASAAPRFGHRAPRALPE